MGVVTAAALHVVLGGLCALGAGFAATYTAIFYLGASEALSIDVVLPWHHPSLFSAVPILNNLILLLVFCLSHSLLARQWVKSLLSSFIPPSLYRQFYFLVATLALSLVCYGWSPLPYPLWHFQWPLLRYIIYGVSMLGLGIVTVAFFSVRPLDFLGIEESVTRLLGSSKGGNSTSGLVETGLYGHVRHPMYSGLLLAMWSHPTMTIGRFLVVSSLTIYLLVAVPLLEEPDLLKVFGQRYQVYLSRVPMFVPWPSLTHSKSKLQ